jgi:tetratricopeptide (TPR) repeat protein
MRKMKGRTYLESFITECLSEFNSEEGERDVLTESLVIVLVFEGIKSLLLELPGWFKFEDGTLNVNREEFRQGLVSFADKVGIRQAGVLKAAEVISFRVDESNAAELLNELVIDVNDYDGRRTSAASAYNMLAYAWGALGRMEKAAEYAAASLQLDIDLYGAGHPAMADRYRRLGRAWKEAGRFNKAIECCLCAIESDIGTFGEKHSRVSFLFGEIGRLCGSSGDHSKAFFYHKKALVADVAVFGEKHLIAASHYGSMALAMKNLGRLQEAASLYGRAHAIYAELLGPNHPTTRAAQTEMHRADEK